MTTHLSNSNNVRFRIGMRSCHRQIVEVEIEIIEDIIFGRSVSASALVLHSSSISTLETQEVEDKKTAQ